MLNDKLRREEINRIFILSIYRSKNTNMTTYYIMNNFLYC